MTDTPPPPTSDEVIVCRVTRWFFKRMIILALMLLGMGLYFFYDGKIGYRKENEIFAAKEHFEGEFLKGFDEHKAAGKLEEWMASARAKGMPTGENGEPPKWATYSASRGWPENPKKHSEDEIRQQFEWGGAMFLLALVVVGKILLDRAKVLVGHPRHMVMPGGAEVRFADVFKVDKRKWDNKGLAYVHHRRDGVEKRVTVDDLKYGGAGLVLDRLLGQFHGELIEKVPEEDEAGGGSGEPAAGA